MDDLNQEKSKIDQLFDELEAMPVGRYDFEKVDDLKKRMDAYLEKRRQSFARDRERFLKILDGVGV